MLKRDRNNELSMAKWAKVASELCCSRRFHVLCIGWGNCHNWEAKYHDKPIDTLLPSHSAALLIEKGM